METPKQKTILVYLVTLIPCTARTVVILGLVATFVNIWCGLELYVFDMLLIIVVGRIVFKLMPGESVGLIIEMADYHTPSLKVIFKQTWARTKSLIMIVFPVYIIGSAAVQTLYSFGVLTPINNALMPLTVWWLGLPAVSGILLIFGILRKEMTLLTLAVIFHTTNLGDHDPGSINSIGAGQYAIHPMASQYTGHSIGVWMEKSNGYNNIRDWHSNHGYCVPATKQIHVSSKILFWVGNLKMRKPHKFLDRGFQVS